MTVYLRKYYIPVLFLFFIMLFAFNVRYLSRFFDWDSVVYAMNIKTSVHLEAAGKTGELRHLRPVFFNPHHLGFETSGYFFIQFIKQFVPDPDLMFVLRLRILGISLVFLMFFLFWHYRLYNDFQSSFIFTALIAFSQGFWFYSHHNDTPLIPAALIASVFFIAVYYSRIGFSPLRLWIAGIIQLASVYFHQTNVLFLTIIPAAIILSERYRGEEFTSGRKVRLIFIYLFMLVLALVVSYLAVGLFLLDRNLEDFGWNHFSYWLFLYASLGRWGAAPGSPDYIMNFYNGIGDVFLNFRGITKVLRVDFTEPWSVKNMPYNINLIFWMLVISTGLINIRRLFGKFKNEMVLLILWLVPSLIFYTWWEGYYFEFWVGTSIALWMLAYYVFESITPGVIHHTFKAVKNIILLFMVFMLFTVNLAFSTIPRSEKKIITKIGTEEYQLKVEKLADEKIYKKN